jgi:hypothetical protein
MENKINIKWIKYFCEDYKTRQILSSWFIEISKEKTDLFVYEIKIVIEKNEIKNSNWDNEEIEPFIEEVKKEIKWDKVYLKINEVEKNKAFKNEQLKNLRIETANKIYWKYSAETQRNILYDAVERIWTILISWWTPTQEDLKALLTAKAIRTDIKKDVLEYKVQKNKILNN